jgi:hypothetical protein
VLIPLQDTGLQDISAIKIDHLTRIWVSLGYVCSIQRYLSMTLNSSARNQDIFIILLFIS